MKRKPPKKRWPRRDFVEEEPVEEEVFEEEPVEEEVYEEEPVEEEVFEEAPVEEDFGGDDGGGEEVIEE